MTIVVLMHEKCDSFLKHEFVEAIIYGIRHLLVITQNI